jgi:hypothetical protein
VQPYLHPPVRKPASRAGMYVARDQCGAIIGAWCDPQHRWQELVRIHDSDLQAYLADPSPSSAAWPPR